MSTAAGFPVPVPAQAEFALEVLKQGTAQAGLGAMSWVDAEQRIVRSGRVGRWALPVHLQQLHRDAAASACSAALACTHPVVKGTAPDHALHLRLRLQAIVAEAARIEHELRMIDRLIE